MLAVLHDIDTAPQIADAFADYRTHQIVATTHENPTLVAVDAPSDGGSSLDTDRIERRHRAGKTGVVVYVIGLGVQAAGVGIVYAGAASASNGNLGGAVGGGFGGVLLVGVGGITSLVGEILLFNGAIGSSKLLDVSTGVGWAGVGLAIGGTVLAFTPVAPVGPLLGIGGLVCGAVQLGHAGRAGRDAGALSIYAVPQPNGLALAGSF